MSCILQFINVCARAIGPANWNKGTERDGNQVLPKSTVSNQGHEDSVQQGTEELH